MLYQKFLPQINENNMLWTTHFVKISKITQRNGSDLIRNTKTTIRNFISFHQIKNVNLVTFFSNWCWHKQRASPVSLQILLFVESPPPSPHKNLIIQVPIEHHPLYPRMPHPRRLLRHRLSSNGPSPSSGNISSRTGPLCRTQASLGTSSSSGRTGWTQWPRSRRPWLRFRRYCSRVPRWGGWSWSCGQSGRMRARWKGWYKGFAAANSERTKER